MTTVEREALSRRLQEAAMDHGGTPLGALLEEALLALSREAQPVAPEPVAYGGARGGGKRAASAPQAGQPRWVSLFHRAWGLAAESKTERYDKAAFGHVQAWMHKAESAQAGQPPERAWFAEREPTNERERKVWQSGWQQGYAAGRAAPLEPRKKT